ncbi:restriction endonuclease subunit S [Cupriavidus oxalaticus]|uniref:Restriction endonuclease subunit S n=1 Tax=Cupriavidus oxalaticus TaxID=96344 RepID=A0A4P7LIK4_9BURK|nr:restriction endonuclease subunit S [Cupriavidus oxalaticus]QBY56064.1 restriction endonuclease subunit S [Cupriavidus oxalaticus]
MSLPRYPQYKDSGVAWLGQVPAHWQVRRLGFYFDERREKVSDKDYPALSVTKAGVVPQLETAAKTDDGDNRRRVCTGDFVINSRSDRKGSAGASRLEGSVSLINTVLQPTGGIDIEFAHHLLRSIPFQEEFYRYGKGIVADLWSTNYSEMRNIVLALPRPEEQSAIATFLDREIGKIDTLIAEQEKLLALLAEKRLATISHAIARGLNPNAPMRDSGVAWLGEVPAHWRVCPIKHLARIGNGSTPNRDNPDYWAEEGYPWLNSSVANLDEVTQADQFVTRLALDECHLPIIEPPAVLVGITGQGKTRGMATKLMFEATVNQHLAYIKPERELIVPFLLRVLEKAYGHLRTESDGAGSTKGAITCEQLGRLAIPLPDTQEQDSIAAFLDAETSRLDALKAEAERAIDLLKERRSALIAAAVTGKIHVRDVVLQELAA